MLDPNSASRKRKADQLDHNGHAPEGFERARARPRRDGSPSASQAPDMPELKFALPTPSDVKSVAFQKPLQITTFSYNAQKDLLFDNSSMRYFVPPPPSVDLGHRFSQWNRHPDEKGRVDNLLKAISTPGCLEHRNRAELICWRGVLTK